MASSLAGMAGTGGALLFFAMAAMEPVGLGKWLALAWLATVGAYWIGWNYLTPLAFRLWSSSRPPHLVRLDALRATAPWDLRSHKLLVVALSLLGIPTLAALLSFGANGIVYRSQVFDEFVSGLWSAFLLATLVGAWTAVRFIGEASTTRRVDLKELVWARSARAAVRVAMAMALGVYLFRTGGTDAPNFWTELLYRSVFAGLAALVVYGAGFTWMRWRLVATRQVLAHVHSSRPAAAA